MSAAVGHLIPRSEGGETFDPANCRAAHFRCNSQRNLLEDEGNPYIPPPSRDW
jgi:5-methylcytosine-specific restriction endonuclease McrA